MMNAQQTANQPANEPAARPLNPWVRCVVSVLLLFHLTAMAAPPWTSTTGSMMSRRLFDGLRPYIDFAYLDHGYQFFAPEPGPSHLIRYDVQLADGSHVHGIMPNLKEHQPRLLYHRHFMLTEFLQGGPPERQWETEPDFRRQRPSEWQTTFARGYANHLLEKLDGRKVSLYWRRHVFPSPDDVLEGMKLDDPRLYREKSLGTFQRESS
jgi:hypothetical protein